MVSTTMACVWKLSLEVSTVDMQCRSQKNNFQRAFMGYWKGRALPKGTLRFAYAPPGKHFGGTLAMCLDAEATESRACNFDLWVFRFFAQRFHRAGKPT